MKVLVSGCSSTGTTLMINIMPYFFNSEVLLEDEVHPYNKLAYNEKGKLFVIKKPAQTKSNPDYFDPRYLLRSGWKLIWMIRDGRDTLCSLNEKGKYHTSTKRFIEVNEMLHEVALDDNVHIIRYEALVQYPQKAINTLSLFLGAGYQKDFLSFYHRVDVASPMNIGIKSRPIDKNSIGNYKNHPDRGKKLKRSIYYKRFCKIQNMMGYEV